MTEDQTKDRIIMTEDYIKDKIIMTEERNRGCDYICQRIRLQLRQEIILWKRIRHVVDLVVIILIIYLHTE